MHQVNNYLKYTQLQMASEALIIDQGTAYFSGNDLIGALIRGNERTTKFMQETAAEFAGIWEVIDHCPNTTTGFSGTLFRALEDNPAMGIKKGEYVISLRSTEFLDDAVRDCTQTNQNEIAGQGFAFGQIDDMLRWFDRINSNEAQLNGQNFSLTGYSLGGHLATALNMVLRDRGNAGQISATYTFNGAGVGCMTEGVSLANAVASFRDIRTNGAQALFLTDYGRDSYLQLKASLASGTMTLEQLKAERNKLDLKLPDPHQIAYINERYDINMLIYAADKMVKLLEEVDRVAGLVSGSENSAPPARVDPSQIAGIDLDYQLAVHSVGKLTKTHKAGMISGGALAYFGRDFAPDSERAGLSPFYELYGRNPPSAVSNSQLHYGMPVPIFMEDQPLGRGWYPLRVLWESGADLLLGEAKLLTNNYATNDFGDSHSIVLLHDTLSLMRTHSEHGGDDMLYSCNDARRYGDDDMLSHMMCPHTRFVSSCRLS